jgi:arylsulfatase A-like enzyme
MSRIIALAAVCLLAPWAIVHAEDSDHPKNAQPNIIYIMADDLGYGDLGCYGQERIQTPRLDQMAADGLKFTSHYAGNTVCAPSRCSLMTGVHTGHAYVRGNREIQPMGQAPLPDETVTVAELLQDAGYTTGLVGKWGLGGPDTEGIPNRQGFDFFYGYLCQRHAHNFYPEFLFRNSDREPLEGNVVDNDRGDGAGEATEKVTYSADLFAKEMLSFIRENKDGPFFLYGSVTIPHANNEAGNRGMEVPELGQYADTDWPDPQKGHAAMITRLDSHVGQVLDLLDELEIADKTLVIFTSDNGPHREGGNNPDFNDSNGPLRGIKRDLYEGGIRVPLIALWPKHVEAGTTTDHPSAFWDFLPTACQLAGVETPDGLDGVSYVPTLFGSEDDQEAHEYLYWEYGGGVRAVRFGKWKAVAKGGGVELYDLESDIGETTNIAADNPDVLSRAKGYLIEAHVDSEFFPMRDIE